MCSAGEELSREIFRIERENCLEKTHTHTHIQASRTWIERSLRIANKQNIDKEVSREKAEHSKKQTGEVVSSRTQVVSMGTQFDFQFFSLLSDTLTLRSLLHS
jgi:hypothetical protein